jgi:hypothetical protein
LTKKYKAKEELTEAVSRILTSEDCGVCKQHFGNCSLLLEAHKQRYPSHFSGTEPQASDKEEAILVDLKAKRYKKK